MVPCPRAMAVGWGGLVVGVVVDALMEDLHQNPSPIPETGARVSDWQQPVNTSSPKSSLLS